MVPDNQMMVVPIEIAAEPGTNDKAHAEGNKRRAIRLLIINLAGLIVGHVNIIRAGGNNFNVATVVHHLLLGRGDEVAQVISLQAQALDGIHDVLLLAGKGLAELGRPIQVIIHPSQNIGIVRERLDVGVPWLLVNGIRIAAILDITIRQDNLRGLRGSGQQDGNQRIGIQGDRAGQLVELRGREGRGGLIIRHGRGHFVLRADAQREASDREGQKKIKDSFHRLVGW